jgi:uncharacterized protein (DUF1778 family)
VATATREGRSELRATQDEKRLLAAAAEHARQNPESGGAKTFVAVTPAEAAHISGF